MMKILCFLLLYFLVLSVSAQSLLPLNYDTLENNSRIEFHGSAFHHSASLRNDFTGKFIFGGEITDEIKDNSFENHDSFQSVGGEITGELSYYHDTLRGSDKLAWMLRGGSTVQFGANYPKDLFGLAMYGNQKYLDEPIRLSNLQSFLMHFSKFGVGVYSKKTKSSISLNAILVHDYFKLNSGNTTIRTNTETGFTDIVADVIFDQLVSDATPGIGVGLDIDYYLPITNEGLFEGFVQLTARNIGAAYFDQINRTDMLGGYRYEGILLNEIPNLFEDNGASFIEEIKDSLNFNEISSGRWVALPGFVQVGKIVDGMSDKQLQYFFGVRAYINAIFRPMAYFGGQYAISNNFHLGGNISYGGYGNFRGGIYAGYQMNKLAIYAGTEDLTGSFLSSAFGRSAVLRLNWSL